MQLFLYEKLSYPYSLVVQVMFGIIVLMEVPEIFPPQCRREIVSDLTFYSVF